MQKQKNTISKKKIVKKRKIRFGRLFLVFLILLLLCYLIKTFVHFPIQNIYIKGTTHLTDQEIIEVLEIENYPSIFKYSTKRMEQKLKSDIRIANAKITKKKFKEVWIFVEEAVPIFYYQSTGETVLSTKETILEKWPNAPVLLNYVPDTKYEKLKEKMLEINQDVLLRISEIAYQPKTVDEERFLFTMNDGNYVYLTLEKLDRINHYVSIYADITAKYGNKKGILNLDSGDYFTIIEN